ncbi:MAG: hypothetical protein K8T25_05020 [Planctomycetia bacterium]|nr:hypothetical protein [Planctomycetia bacterium]
MIKSTKDEPKVTAPEPASGTVASSPKNGKRATKVKAKRGAAKAAPWTFPKNPLEEAIAIAKAIEDKNGGNPMKADLLARAVAYNQPNDWRFLNLLRSANLYGLVSGTGQHATVSLEKIGQDVVAPGSPQDRKAALLAAFRNVEDFKKVDDFYGTKRIPEDEYFLNTLTRQFSIPRDRASIFADVFRANTTFLRSFNVHTGASRVALMSYSVPVAWLNKSGSKLPSLGCCWRILPTKTRTYFTNLA